MTGSTRGGEYLPDMDFLRRYVAQQGQQHVASIISRPQDKVGGYDALRPLFDGGSLRRSAYDIQREITNRTTGLYQTGNLSNGLDRSMIASGLYVNASDKTPPSYQGTPYH